jgi:hypothetical protein
MPPSTSVAFYQGEGPAYIDHLFLFLPAKIITLRAFLVARRSVNFARIDPAHSLGPLPVHRTPDPRTGYRELECQRRGSGAARLRALGFINTCHIPLASSKHTYAHTHTKHLPLSFSSSLFRPPHTHTPILPPCPRPSPLHSTS